MNDQLRPSKQRTATRVLLVENDSRNTEPTTLASVDGDEEMVIERLSPKRAQTAIGEPRFDIALIDMSREGESGMALLKELARSRNGEDMLVITLFGNKQDLMRSIQAAADGRQPARTVKTKRKLDEAQRSTLKPMSPFTAQQLLQLFKASGMARNSRLPLDRLDNLSEEVCETRLKASGLSARQIEVLRLLAKGFTAVEIGELLCVSAQTIATHVRTIYSKLGVHSRAEVVFEARQLGVL